MNFSKKPWIIGLSIFLIGFILGNQLHRPTETHSDLPAGSKADMSLFWDVWDRIEHEYYDADDFSSEMGSQGAVRGLVESLGDPFSAYMNADETKAFETSLEGELQGIGAEMMMKDGALTVVSPLKNSPAQKAGLLPGDIVTMINGELSSELTMMEAIMKIRGPKGSHVTLNVYREGESDILEYTITREEISIPSVAYRTENQGGRNIGVISLYQFSSETSSEFLEAVRALELDSMEALVLDLRGNGGGYLQESVKVISEFFTDERKAVITKQRHKEDEILYTTGGGRLDSIPVTVLINEGSASASEIVAGALQDYKRATIMGVKSFGKGSVQEYLNLQDGSSLRLTIAKWYTPLDRTIHEKGIEPDILVEMDTVHYETDQDTQMQEALKYLLSQLTK